MKSMSEITKEWLLDRVRPFQSIVEYLSRKHVPQHKHSVWYYFGGVTLFFFIIQIITGVLLLFYYQPTSEPVLEKNPVTSSKQTENLLFELQSAVEADSSKAALLRMLGDQPDARIKMLYPSGAYASIEYIRTQVRYGWLIHSLHSWSSNVLILFVFIHLFSAFLMKAYRKPRELMWYSGSVLFALVLGFGFTGYVLPWDEVAYYATSIGTEYPRALPIVGEWLVRLLRGADQVTGETLTRMFGIHVVVLPLSVLGILGLHLVLALIQGSSIPISIRTGVKQVPFFSRYIYREFFLWIILLIALVAVCYFFPWELGTPFDLLQPSSPPVGIHPEWYFMFLFQTLNILPSRIAGIDGILIGQILFGIAAAFWFFIPVLDRRSARNVRSPLFTIIGIIAILYFIVMTTWGYISVSQH